MNAWPAFARTMAVRSAQVLAVIVDSRPAGREIHVITDNLSANKSKKAFDFLEANRAVRIHYTTIPDLLQVA
jgi:hypothetical protein